MKGLGRKKELNLVRMSKIKNGSFMENEEEGSPSIENTANVVFLPPDMGSSDPTLDIVGLYGEIDEDRCAEVVYSLLLMREKVKELDESGKITHRPFEFVISTHGGSAADTFGVYDIMRMVRSDCEISTFGIGKVMSAGVLLLAAGTKGKRKIGKNCRVMLHCAAATNYGSLHDLENELEEVQLTQARYIKCLADETKLTKKQLKKMLDKRVNVYLNAEEVVEMGIADVII